MYTRSSYMQLPKMILYRQTGQWNRKKLRNRLKYIYEHLLYDKYQISAAKTNFLINGVQLTAKR